MRCVHCHQDTKGSILETRAGEEQIYRRRCCGSCGKHFVTMESQCHLASIPKEHRVAASMRAPRLRRSSQTT